MDKFGIFELLDTLAQFASDTNGEKPPEEKTAPKTRASADDKSFLPPDFNGNATSAEEQRANRNAINSLYERHDDISKRIDKKSDL